MYTSEMKNLGDHLEFCPPLSSKLTLKQSVKVTAYSDQGGIIAEWTFMERSKIIPF